MVFIIIIVGIMGWESDIEVIEVIDGWMGTRRLMKLNNDI